MKLGVQGANPLQDEQDAQPRGAEGCSGWRARWQLNSIVWFKERLVTAISCKHLDIMVSCLVTDSYGCYSYF